MTWTAPELAPPLLTITTHQRKDVSALDRFNVHRCPTRWVFSGTGLKLVTRPATIRYLDHSATVATQEWSNHAKIISLRLPIANPGHGSSVEAGIDKISILNQSLDNEQKRPYQPGEDVGRRQLRHFWKLRSTCVEWVLLHVNVCATEIADGLAREDSHKDSMHGGCLTFSEIATRVKQDVSSSWKQAPYMSGMKETILGLFCSGQAIGEIKLLLLGVSQWTYSSNSTACAGLNQEEWVQWLQLAFGAESPCRTTVFRWFKEFCSGHKILFRMKNTQKDHGRQ
ncbi:uncharacterized protein TNCV_3708761 [Trichonephila clavipes]|nr:uncharacterized protein TNCV_3708761 [Trichonephila clavipes]